MSVVAALAAGSAVFLMATRGRDPQLADRIGQYLYVPRVVRPGTKTSEMSRPAQAGLTWSDAELRSRRFGAVAIGVVGGLLIAQGDLFVAGSGRSAPGLALIGGLSGGMALQIWITQRQQERGRQLAAELPLVADLLALRILAGDSVAAAVDHVIEWTSGIAAEEFVSILEGYRSGGGLSESLQAAASAATVPEAARLYGFLANAHATGGRLADALLGLAADFRAHQERALQVEGGKRALAVYAPIIVLMIPVALLFLMYPTLEGLNTLSSVP